MREAKRERENEKGKLKRRWRRTHPEKIDEEDSGNLILKMANVKENGKNGQR